MDVSTAPNCQNTTMVRINFQLFFPHIPSKCERLTLCLRQTAVFATASWCPPSSPPSLFPISRFWPLTRLSLHLPHLPLFLLSVLTLCVAAARPLALPHRLIVFGPPYLRLELGSLRGPVSPPSLHLAGPASQTHPAGLLGHNQPHPWSPHRFPTQPRLRS